MRPVTINGATHRDQMLNAHAFSPDGRLLAFATDDKSVKLWDARSGRLLHTLIGHGKQVTRVAFSPDGRLLASGDLSGRVNLWGVPSRPGPDGVQHD